MNYGSSSIAVLVTEEPGNIIFYSFIFADTEWFQSESFKLFTQKLQKRDRH